MKDSTTNTDEKKGPEITRRSWMKAVGVGAATITTGSGAAAATTAGTSGYGAGGYGAGGYGDLTSGLTVRTDGANAVGETKAILTGSVTGLGTASSTTVYFEYREVGRSNWNRTGEQALTSVGSFSKTVSSLTSGAEYEFRAAAATDSDTDTGTLAPFSTTSSGNDPVIDRFSVSEAGKPDPHADITVSWDVSDPDGDLSSIDITVSDSTGTVQAVSWNVSGPIAFDTDSFKIKRGDGKLYDVTLTVTDRAGNTVSETTEVSA